MSDVLQSASASSKKKKSFLDFFPTPKLLLLSTVGLSFSDRGIQSIEFKPGAGPGELVLAHSVEVPLPPGAILSGYVQDKAVVVQALSELKSKHSLHYVKATLPEEKAYLFTVEVDTEPYASLRDRVAFTIEENVPVELATSVFDFEIIGDVKGQAKVKVAVSVLPTKVVETYLEVYGAAGLTPVSFEVESQAIARAIVPEGDERTHLIINLGEGETGLYVVEDEVVQFSTTPAFGTKQNGETFSDLNNLKLEARKLFAFWNTRLDKEGIPKKKIEKIILTGDGAAKEKFVSEFMSDIDIEYTLANVWVNAFTFKTFLPEMSFSESLSYAAAIGAALPDKEPKYV